MAVSSYGLAEPIPDDWAFRPRTAPAVPGFAGVMLDNPIDAFVRARLAAEGLKPAPQADRRTLLRRLSFDLTGLPPEPQELDAFFADARPDALERQVERLLASPAYGERWARHWLDVVRFGESQGFEYDRIRDHAWRYRDYVIRAFNDDKPYDQFVREQLAGDVLEPVTSDGIVATGFLVAGPWDQAGNSAASASLRAAVREAELEDLLGTVGQAFLGVTLNCARCHTHKFDPVPQRDYYRVKAVFQGVRHGDRSALPASDLQRVAERRKAQESELAAVERRLTSLAGVALDRWAAGRGAAQTSSGAGVPGGPLPWARWSFEVDARDELGRLPGTLNGGARVVGGRLRLDGEDDFVSTAGLGRDLGAKTLEVWVVLGSRSQRGGGVITVETANGSVFDSLTFGERQPARWAAGSNGFRRTRDLAVPEETAGPVDLLHLALVYQTNGTMALYRNGVPWGESWTPDAGDGRSVTFPSDSRVLLGKRHTGGGNAFWAGEIEEARLYDRALSAEEIERSHRAGPSAGATRDQLAAQWTAAERAEWDGLVREQDRLWSAIRNPAPAPQVYAANIDTPGPTFVLHRGEADKPRDPVTAAALSVIQEPGFEFGFTDQTPEAERRRRFADWVADPRNPLTARVIVNRVWQHHFGRGLVATPNDLGKMGDRPSHPELLDWLAGWFVAKDGADWSLKRLHRLILGSRTWRQSSDAAVAATDSDNRLLSRYSPRRLEAEAVRDAMLLLGGELNRSMGGASFRPFIHKGNGGQNEYFAADLPGPDTSRRTVYRICVHSARDPMLDSLDCPEFSTRTPVRSNTTTPLQALSLMNNPFVQRMAAGLAARVERAAGSNPGTRVDQLWWEVLGREPDPAERVSAIELIREHGAKAVAWTLLNTGEFVMVR
jgi:hypothetical protein